MREKLIELCLRVVPGANQEMQRAYIEALMSLCERADASTALDIGTNTGVSCLSLASAMHLMGKSVRHTCTLDIHQGPWMRTVSHRKAQFAELGIDMDEIQTIELDFKRLVPQSMMISGPRMIFYDIHDGDDGSGAPSSPLFIQEWIPLIERAIVAVHDITPCEKGWVRPAHWGTPPSFSMAEYGGQWYRGFGECKNFIDFIKSEGGAATFIPGTSIMWFEVRDGRSV